ncbi:MAG: hypothetical protein JWM51_1194 [Microbacteriaceae bacterium]|nr:hypothetical protein [Microbacteriaceae bacterium]
MDVGAWSVSTAASTGLFVALCLTFIPAYARWRARRHAAQIGVDLPSHLERVVGARLMARERCRTIGGIVFIGAAALVSIVTRPQRHLARRLWQNLRWHDTADAATDAA